MIDIPLYLITDRTQTAGRALPAVVADALEGGVDTVQLREKDLPSRQLYELARELRAITHARGARLLVNDRIDIALAVEADGVHLGIASLPLGEARRLLGPRRLIGYSAHSVEEALTAQEQGADFVTFGPVYATPSKAVYGPPLGVDQLARACRTLTVPVLALGGVKPASITELLEAGAAGVALISAIIAAGDPRQAAASLLEKIRAHAPLRR